MDDLCIKHVRPHADDACFACRKPLAATLGEPILAIAIEGTDRRLCRRCATEADPDLAHVMDAWCRVEWGALLNDVMKGE